MQILNSRSLKEKRATKAYEEEREFLISDMEITQIEHDQKMSDMEIDIIELQMAIIN